MQRASLLTRQGKKAVVVVGISTLIRRELSHLIGRETSRRDWLIGKIRFSDWFTSFDPFSSLGITDLQSSQKFTKMESNEGVPNEVLAKLKSDFVSEKKNLLAQNVCTKFDTLEVTFSRRVAQASNHVYNCKV